MKKMLFFSFVFLSLIFSIYNVNAGISVGENYLPQPSISVEDSYSKSVNVKCNFYSNYNSVVGVIFVKKTSYGFSKPTGYDIELDYKKSYERTKNFVHTVSSEGEYGVVCIELYDFNGDKKFSADEIEISKSKIITVGSSNSNDDYGMLFVYVRDSDDNLVNPYTSVVVKDSYGRVVYENSFVPSAGIKLELNKYYSISLDYKGVKYDKTFYFEKQNFDNSMSLKVSLNTDNNNNFVSDVSLNIYVSPSDPSDGKIHFECTAYGNDDFSKGTFYLVSGEKTIELIKGIKGYNYNVTSPAPDNSRSGDYRYLSKGYYYPYCKYYASDGKVFTSDFVEVVYD